MPKGKDRVYYQRRIGKELKGIIVFIIERARDPKEASVYINRLSGRGRNIKEQYENLVSQAAAIRKEMKGGSGNG
jgi:hypothetical protein